MRIINALLSTGVLFVFLVPQALAAPPGGHLNIEEVAVTSGDPDTTLVISGTDFDFGSPLEVTLAGVPATITSSSGTTITATVLTASFPAGDYLLNVSTGNGQSQNDEYDLTIGAVDTRERAAFFEAIALAQAFTDCVEISANDDSGDDQADNDRAEACFKQILSDDFVNTIDGVGFGPPPPGAMGGTVFFPTPQSFIDFANGPADDIRENLTVQAGVYTVRNVPGENGDLGFTGGQNGSVSIRTSLSVFQNTLSDSFIFGELGSGPSGMIIRARLFFEVTEESPNSWKITRSRFSILDIVRADLMSLPRVTDLDEF